MADIQLFVYSVYIPTPIDDAFLTDRMRSSQAPNTRAWFAILLLLFSHYMLQFTVVHCNWPTMMEIGVCFFLCVVSMFCFSKMKRSWITQGVFGWLPHFASHSLGGHGWMAAVWFSIQVWPPHPFAVKKDTTA